MEQKKVFYVSEDARRLHEEFKRCQTEEEIQTLIEKEKKINESRNNNEIPHYDMTLEEFDNKYHLTTYEEVWGRILNITESEMLAECGSWTPSQWAEYMTKGQTFDDDELDRFIEEEIIES